MENDDELNGPKNDFSKNEDSMNIENKNVSGGMRKTRTRSHRHSRRRSHRHSRRHSHRKSRKTKQSRKRR